MNKDNKNKYCINIFLFGSILYKDDPDDIDILILYPKDTNYIDEIFGFKNNLKIILEKELSINIDILILSYEEEQEMNFANNEGAINLEKLHKKLIF